jgi:hypothetical protein
MQKYNAWFINYTQLEIGGWDVGNASVHIKDSITHKILAKVTLKSYKALSDFIDYIHSMNLDIKEKWDRTSKEILQE